MRNLPRNFKSRKKLIVTLLIVIAIAGVAYYLNLVNSNLDTFRFVDGLPYP